MSCINVLGDFVHRIKYEDLPKEVIECAKLRFIDFLSTAFSGYRIGLHKPFLRIHQSSTGNRQATLIGEGVKIYWQHAALLNSSMCPVDMLDGSRFAGVHPSSIVFPAALATFEANASHGKNLTGKDLLTAVVLGYELIIRIGQVINPSAIKRGFQITPIVGPLASAATTGKIMDLDTPSLRNALSIAATLGAGLIDAFKAPEPFVEIQIARSCEAGMIAAALANEGVQGNNEILEKAFIPAHSDEYRLEFILENMTNPYGISQTYIKVHGGCRHIHAPIDATLDIVHTHKIRWDDIEKIAVKTYSVSRMFEFEHPETGDDAKFNMAFGIAVALIRGNALPDQFTTKNLKDEQIKKLMKKVVIEVSLDLDKDYPVKRGTIVEVTTKGRKIFSRALDLARGEPEFPVTREEIHGKFKRSTAVLIPEAQADKIIEFIDTMEGQKELESLFWYLKITE